MRLSQLVVLGGLATLVGCSTLEQRATTAAVADGVTTLVGAPLGLVELNPLGVAIAIGVKLPMLVYAQSLPDNERAEFHALAAPLWGGAAASNVCMIAALLTGGAFAPVCIVAGVAVAWQQWEMSTEERTFYTECAAYRAHTGESFRCIYRAESAEQ